MKICRCLVLACIALASLEVRGAAAQVQVNEAFLVFWEQAPGPLAPPAERDEAVVFDAVHSRLIGFNLAFDHDAPGVAVTFPVSCVYMLPDSTTTAPFGIDFQIQPTKRRSAMAGAQGWDGTGHWMPGTYRVQCSAGGNVLVERTFEMLPQAPAVKWIQFYEKEALGPGVPGPYATVFDAAQSRFMATEVTFTIPAMDPEIVHRLSGPHYVIRCQYIRPDGRPMTDFGVGLQFDGDSSGTGAVGYEQPGNWVPGTYHAICSASGRILGSATFEMASDDGAIANARTTASSYFPPSATELAWERAVRVTQIRLFPTGSELTLFNDRQYTTRFYAGQTSRIAVELEFEHALGEEMRIPIDCNYYLSDGQATPVFRFPYKSRPDWYRGYTAMGFGWDQLGQWPQGEYTALCTIHNRPVAVERFSVLP